MGRRGMDELSINAYAGTKGFFEFLDDLIFFLRDVGFQFLLAHLVLVFRLERDHHPAEVLADEFVEELGAGVCFFILLAFPLLFPLPLILMVPRRGCIGKGK